MALREKLAKYNDVIERAIRKTALQGRVDQFGNLAGTSRVFGYVCKIHDNDDPDENLRNTVDVQEYNYDEEDYDDQAVGFHEGVLLSAIQGTKGFFIVPQLFSEVVIVQDPANKVEYVTMYSHAKIIQLQSVDEVNIGVKEYEDLQALLEKLFNKIGSGICKNGSPLTTAPEILAMVSEIPKIQSHKVKLT